MGQLLVLASLRIHSLQPIFEFSRAVTYGTSCGMDLRGRNCQRKPGISFNKHVLSQGAGHCAPCLPEMQRDVLDHGSLVPSQNFKVALVYNKESLP